MEDFDDPRYLGNVTSMRARDPCNTKQGPPFITSLQRTSICRVFLSC